jgi:N utilization substance protein A
VVEEENLENDEAEILLIDDRAKDKQIGDVIEESIPSEEFGRIGAQAAKQVILQKLEKQKESKCLMNFLHEMKNWSWVKLDGWSEAMQLLKSVN